MRASKADVAWALAQEAVASTRASVTGQSARARMPWTTGVRWDDDLELAGHLQRLIRGLFLYTELLARAAPGAAQSCASADRTGLTATELAVLIHLADGHTAYGIALRLQMAPRTASKHLEHIYRKLGVTNRLTAVTAAQEAGILTAAHPRLASGPQHRALGDGEEQRG